MNNPNFTRSALVISAVGVLIIMYIMQEFLLGSIIANIFCIGLLVTLLSLILLKVSSLNDSNNKKDT